MCRIDVDLDVYAVLEENARGFEQPNDVLRRLLLTAGVPATEAPETLDGPAPSIAGALAPLLASGSVAPGDTLTHVQVRKGRHFVGSIEAGGWIRTDLGRYRQPSPALAALVGTAIDGWHRWVHDRTGKTLRQLRVEMGVPKAVGAP